jgi:phospho-N-acetylmuramoyl-pentapeptide-transferase
VLGQVTLGLIVGLTMYFHDGIVIREKVQESQFVKSHNILNAANYEKAKEVFNKESVKSTKTSIPFFKNNELDYSVLISWAGENYQKWAWLVFIPIVILIITAVSNGANLTDGIDGLATSTSAIIGATLGILAWVSGNIIFANYLNIMYIPNIGELAIFISAFVGATIGFLWYNTYPAQVFMGDTGSLAIGGIIAVLAILIRKELLIPILCGIFLVENLSVMMQVSYFKYTKKRYGEGRRIFKMSPLHHHYQKLGYSEPKIVVRFVIVGLMLAVFTVITLKLR